MSEYQYYEFQAIDRPLTVGEMRELRAYSTRATITPTRFVNHYEWGSFKGNPAAWMEKYFDAFFYFSNWRTYELMVRLPRRALDLVLAKQYCRGEVARARSTGGGSRQPCSPMRGTKRTSSMTSSRCSPFPVRVIRSSL